MNIWIFHGVNIQVQSGGLTEQIAIWAQENRANSIAVHSGKKVQQACLAASESPFISQESRSKFFP
jgi:hypothetical protein